MPAASVIIPRIFNTLKLACASIVVAVAVGTVAGILSAVRRHSIVDLSFDYDGTPWRINACLLVGTRLDYDIFSIFDGLPSGGMGGLRVFSPSPRSCWALLLLE